MHLEDTTARRARKANTSSACENSVGMIGAVLWDLDGTLVDSEEKYWLSWRDTMAGEGISITREQFLATFGLRNDAIVPRWLPQGASSDQIRRVGDAKETLYRKLVRQDR